VFKEIVTTLSLFRVGAQLGASLCDAVVLASNLRGERWLEARSMQAP
jgi:hypothetical protein